jgi:hypothetical protein
MAAPAAPSLTTLSYCSVAESDRSARNKQADARRAAGDPTLRYPIERYAAGYQVDNIGFRLTGAGVSYVQYISADWHVRARAPRPAAPPIAAAAMRTPPPPLRTHTVAR